MSTRWLVLLVVSPAVLVGGNELRPDPLGSASRAIAFLTREVGAWRPENGCFSCHNNGDGVRALYGALETGLTRDVPGLDATTAFLRSPARWDQEAVDAEYVDKRLARVQFATALVAAHKAGVIRGRESVREAARRLVADQAADGSWPVDVSDSLGSPITYGRALATHFARATLRRAELADLEPAIARATRWLHAAVPRNTPEAAAILLSLEPAELRADNATAQRCLAMLRRGQSDEGGWGPYPSAAPEPFDTAVVVLALQRLPSRDAEWSARRRRGRAYLVAHQLPDGSWPETTRPAGADSYAQRISTTAWATLALVATRGEAAE